MEMSCTKNILSYKYHQNNVYTYICFTTENVLIFGLIFWLTEIFVCNESECSVHHKVTSTISLSNIFEFYLFFSGFDSYPEYTDTQIEDFYLY